MHAFDPSVQAVSDPTMRQPAGNGTGPAVRASVPRHHHHHSSARHHTQHPHQHHSNHSHQHQHHSGRSRGTAGEGSAGRPAEEGRSSSELMGQAHGQGALHALPACLPACLALYKCMYSCVASMHTLLPETLPCLGCRLLLHTHAHTLLHPTHHAPITLRPWHMLTHAPPPPISPCHLPCRL